MQRKYLCAFSSVSPHDGVLDPGHRVVAAQLGITRPQFSRVGVERGAADVDRGRGGHRNACIDRMAALSWGGHAPFERTSAGQKGGVRWVTKRVPLG
jgi:hypothetical protein